MRTDRDEIARLKKEVVDLQQKNIELASRRQPEIVITQASEPEPEPEIDVVESIRKQEEARINALLAERNGRAR